MTRREARIVSMQILYSADFSEITISEARKNVAERAIDDSVKFFLDLVEANLEKIDSIIENALVNYSLGRLNLVDKAIIRLATAEIIEGSTPRNIIINEALEITKEFSDQGDHKAVSFNNRLLDNICKSLS